MQIKARHRREHVKYGFLRGIAILMINGLTYASTKCVGEGAP